MSASLILEIPRKQKLYLTHLWIFCFKHGAFRASESHDTRKATHITVFLNITIWRWAVVSRAQ